MSFTSVLRGIEQGVLKAGAIVAQVEGIQANFEPIISALVPQSKLAAVKAAEGKIDVTFSDLSNITKSIQMIGAQSGMTNDQKLAAEAALAGQLLQAVGHVTDKNIGDPVELSEGVTDLMKAIVRIQNALKHNA